MRSHTSSSFRPGLTLVELLASVAILAAAGAAMASVFGEASASVRRADLRRRALAVYEEWRRSPPGRPTSPAPPASELSGAPWTTVDSRGDAWRVVFALDAYGFADQPWPGALRWGVVRVERLSREAAAPPETLLELPRVAATPLEDTP